MPGPMLEGYKITLPLLGCCTTSNTTWDKELLTLAFAPMRLKVMGVLVLV